LFLKAKVKELQEVKNEEKRPLPKDEDKKIVDKENVSEFELIPIGRIEQLNKKEMVDHRNENKFPPKRYNDDNNNDRSNGGGFPPRNNFNNNREFGQGRGYNPNPGRGGMDAGFGGGRGQFNDRGGRGGSGGYTGRGGY
jgi:hypothetical protein